MLSSNDIKADIQFNLEYSIKSEFDEVYQYNKRSYR